MLLSRSSRSRTEQPDRRCRRALRLGMAVLALLSLSLSSRADDDALHTVYVFAEGRPVDGVAARLDGADAGLTDGYGSLRLSMAPGRHRLQLRYRGELVLSREFEAFAAERAQWIVSLDQSGRVALSVESSHAGVAGAAGPAAAPGADPEAPPGTLFGRVISAEDGSPVPRARLYVSGTAAEAETDAEGRFTLELPAGEYAVSTTHPEFATRTLDGVRVAPRETTELDFEITPAGLELEEFVVVEPYIEGSLTSVMAERRQSDAVTDVLSAEQISRAGDSDAAGALKRVTGLTLVDGEYVYVRGLGERYSSVLLNGAGIPSPDPTRRVVPLDLFPTDVIRSVAIQKTAAAGMPGDFGGGTVQLRTVGFPEEFVAKLGVSGGYNEQATFRQGLRTDGGGRDWTGFDDGTRELPPSIAERIEGGRFLRPRSPSNPGGLTPEDFETMGEDLASASDYRIFEDDLHPDVGFSGVIGNSFELEDRGRWGFLAAVQYGQEWSDISETRRVFSATTGGLQLRDEVELRRTVRNVDLGGYFNAGLELGDDHRLALNSMYLRQTEDEARISEGLAQSQVLQRWEIEWIENELLSNQFIGEHTLPLLDWGPEFTLDWQYTKATANRFEPNTRRFRRDDDDGDGIFEFSTRADSNSQVFGDLEDDLTDWSASVSVPVELHEQAALRLGFGAGRVERERDAVLRTFGFSGRFTGDILLLPLDRILVPESIGPGRLQLQESTRPDDNYTATQTLASRYANLDLTLFQDWRLTAGLREEKNDQQVTTFSIANPGELIVGRIEQTDRLPSGALTWAYSDDAQVRLGYAETVNRPDFRELSPSPFRDPVLDLVTVGNESLRTASIKNYDARWEYYFSPTDTFSVAAFYKEFENPIEKTFSSGGARIITLQNALAAEVYGVEFDLYRSLGFLEDVRWIGSLSPWPFGKINWSNYFVSANYARLESSVEIDTSQTIQTNAERSLQGASPWVGNLQFGYANRGSPHEWTVLYNEFGARIAQAGVQTQPDILEAPFPQLDFVYRYRFGGGWRFSLKFQNLLDSDVKFIQGDRVTRQYRKGREVSLGLQWRY